MADVLDRSKKYYKFFNSPIDQFTNSPISQYDNLLIDEYIDWPTGRMKGLKIKK